MSPALAGGFLTTAPPGKSKNCIFNVGISLLQRNLIHSKLSCRLYLQGNSKEVIKACVPLIFQVGWRPTCMLLPLTFSHNAFQSAQNVGFKNHRKLQGYFEGNGNISEEKLG